MLSNVTNNRSTLPKRKLDDNEEVEPHNESESQNSSLSSDEDNDSLFQPTSIFEYDTEQPMHNNIGNSIHVNDYYKNSYNHQESPEQEYNLIHNFVSSDSDEEEEEKIDKNDTEWSNTSFKSSKRKSNQKSTGKKSTKYSQKIILQDGSKKHQVDSKLQQSTISPIKKKRGRKPKYSLDPATFPNDENKERNSMSQKQSLFDSLENSDTNLYPKIFSNSISSVNSSRRASETSTLNTFSDDEIFNHSEIERKLDNSVLMEDNSVLNQSEINKICKKNLKMKATAIKKVTQPKKRNTKSTSSSSGSISGNYLAKLSFKVTFSL